MLLLVGLGNPGQDYARHRHNIGFMALDRIAEDWGFSSWRRRFQGDVAEGKIDGHKILLLKPLTFMNESGRSVGDAARFFKLGPDDVVVLYDEIDLAPGKVRCKQGGGHSGHNGIRSLHAHLGPDYRRVRIGVGHPGDKDRVIGHVLSSFSGADKTWLEPLLNAISDAAPLLAEHRDEKFQSQVAHLMQPAKPTKKAVPGGRANEDDNGN
jgi:PTH1 family peptidyl-tRNA hydrolase